MRQLRETFTDQEFELLKKAKGNQRWHDFILKLRPASLDLDLATRRMMEIARIQPNFRQNYRIHSPSISEMLISEGWKELILHKKYRDDAGFEGAIKAVTKMELDIADYFGLNDIFILEDLNVHVTMGQGYKPSMIYERIVVSPELFEKIIDRFQEVKGE